MFFESAERVGEMFYQTKGILVIEYPFQGWLRLEDVLDVELRVLEWFSRGFGETGDL